MKHDTNRQILGNATVVIPSEVEESRSRTYRYFGDPSTPLRFAQDDRRMQRESFQISH